MEIVNVLAADEDGGKEFYCIKDSSGVQEEEFGGLNPKNIVAVLNFYGYRGWEVIGVREIESEQADKFFGVRETYTLKR